MLVAFVRVDQSCLEADCKKSKVRHSKLLRVLCQTGKQVNLYTIDRHVQMKNHLQIPESKKLLF